jgi:hypothetical protein
VDPYTIRFTFPDPSPVFPEMLAGATPIGGGHSLRGREGMGGYAPAHYLKQFHKANEVVLADRCGECFHGLPTCKSPLARYQ